MASFLIIGGGAKCINLSFLKWNSSVFSWLLDTRKLHNRNFKYLSHHCIYFLHVCTVTQSCPTLCDPMESPPGFSVRGILQARILELVAISSSRGSSRPRAIVSWEYCIGRQILHLLSHLAAAAKSLQSSPTLWDPIDGSPPGSPIPGILQAGTLEWVAISFSNAWKWKVKGKLLSRVQFLATPWTAAHQAPPAMGFSRQECWSGVLLTSPLSHLTLWQLCQPDYLLLLSSN